MESYITRVEFLDPSNTDYYDLYSALERRGFSRHIQCDEEVGYYFPMKEFSYSGTADLNQMLGLVTEAAQEILKPCNVEIFESGQRQPSELLVR
ncbi:hypothetical protein [Pedosphaera parvula]|uniref:DUF2622 domain-containing protein n=1 Tax=Pedosphaera parvula (strain Ellin514) TaxID=320771 RepID=B9X9N5_PEDPL|nr:hypothetical protein [Pedosphaera parvula]EEF63279.1 hypothetical protein Cflav_PD5914 [Pedosphaera parvula Ellin514]